MLKFRPVVTTLEDRANPSGPDLIDPVGGPVGPPAVPPPAEAPPSHGSDPAPSNPNNPVH